MSDDVIRVENLGKKYRIRHEQTRRYTALRDVIANKLGSLLRAPGALLRRNGRVRSSMSPPAQEDFWALKDVSFEIKRGEVVGIIGRNGAGKSTLLKILSRITEPTRGRVSIKGRVASLLEVGTGFHAELTGRENIFLNGAILGMTRVEIKRKFDEIVAFAEVEKFLDTPVKRYSSGMYVRLAFAVAAHLEPEILIIDEVLAVGDAGFQKKCLGKMSDVAHGGRTVIFVSHNMIALRSLCTRGIVLDEGIQKIDGLINEALNFYSANSVVAVRQSWTRRTPIVEEKMAFEEINGEISGEQPYLILECELSLRCIEACPPCFVAVDICDGTSTPIMQALPHPEPFIKGSPGSHRLRLHIELPPLIPGVYQADFWVGSHYTRTFDHIRAGLAFEVTETPSKNRSFPHCSAHGHVVPPSVCELLTPSTADQTTPAVSDP